jgi:hypothetical protein
VVKGQTGVYLVYLVDSVGQTLSPAQGTCATKTAHFPVSPIQKEQSDGNVRHLALDLANQPKKSCVFRNEIRGPEKKINELIPGGTCI